MAKQWTRNYDNLFSACFGVSKCNYVTKDVPDHTQPCFRNPIGTYFTPFINDTTTRVLSSGLVIPPPSYLAADSYGNIKYSDNTHGNDAISKIVFDSGESDLSYEDYNVFSPIIGNLTTLTQSTSNTYNADTHTYTRSYTLPFSYSGTSPITIKGFGIYIGIPYNYSGSYTYYHLALVYRETLDEPITLEQNDTIEITFSQSIVQPNYTPYPTT